MFRVLSVERRSLKAPPVLRTVRHVEWRAKRAGAPGTHCNETFYRCNVHIDCAHLNASEGHPIACNAANKALFAANALHACSARRHSRLRWLAASRGR